MQKIIVTKGEAGWRFDRYLKKMLPEASTGFLYKMLRKKNITLNGRKAAGNEIVASGDSVELFFSQETFRKFSGELSVSGAEGEMADVHEKLKGNGHAISGGKQSVYREAYHKLGDIPVIYEDEDLLILDKPAGVLSQKAEKEDISLNEWMLGYLVEKGEFTSGETGHFKPSVCNRLDRNTSGLVLCGKSVKGSQFLAKMLRERILHKYYETYAAGQIEHEIALKGYLKKEEARNRSAILTEESYRREAAKNPALAGEYKRIETVIKPLYYDERRDCTKLEILLVTGKSHQIRAHLASNGHPILGDWKYGWKPERKSEENLKYQLLCACRVEFPEIEGEFAYLSGKCFEAVCPDPFSEKK